MDRKKKKRKDERKPNEASDAALETKVDSSLFHQIIN